MAVAYDVLAPGATGKGQQNTTTINWDHTAGSGSNRLLIVGVTVGRGVSTDTLGVTYGGVSMTSAARVFSDNQNDGFIELFYLVAPATGLNNIVVTCSASRDLLAGSNTFTGVNQTTPLSNTTTAFGSGTTASVNVTSAPGNMVIDVVGCGTSVTSSNQTLEWLNNQSAASGAGCGAQSIANGASSVTMSYAISSDWWGMVATSINMVAPDTPPTFVSATGTAFNTTGTSKTLSITTQAGDVVVIYGGTEDTGSTKLLSVSGNSIAFTQQQILEPLNYAPVYIWTGTDNTGGTNWTLTINADSTSSHWGAECLVFRNSLGVGSSNSTNVASGAPTLSLTTVQNRSAIVVVSTDWNADGSAHTWLTVNSITPSSGNGLETTYLFDSGKYTIYGAYYSDAGTAGAKSVGLSTPNTQKYAIAAVEVFGTVAAAAAVYAVAWFGA